MLNEADTRVKLVDPKLHEAGWKEEMIERGRHISPGRIIDESGNRKRGTEIDYILSYSSMPIAVVEAEPESKSALPGMGQAKDDAENYMHILFAYSTNGHEIEEFDFTTNTQKTLERMPAPEELFKRYRDYVFKGKVPERKGPLIGRVSQLFPRQRRQRYRRGIHLNSGLILPFANFPTAQRRRF